MRMALAGLLLLSGVTACKNSRGGNEPVVSAGSMAQNTTPGASASLLRRLAEAADGFRDGQARYVVADPDFPHKVAGVFLDSNEAKSVASARDSNYAVFGPYRTIDEPADSSALSERVDSVVVFKTKGRETYRGAEYDALFWSLPAFDKFVVPYLTVVSSAREALKQRELYRKGKLPFAHSSEVGHLRGSF